MEKIEPNNNWLYEIVNEINNRTTYDKEYYLKNKENFNKAAKKYQDNNKESQKEYHRIYHLRTYKKRRPQKNKNVYSDELKKEKHKEYQKRYYQKNRELIIERAKKYYEENKKEINQRLREKNKNNT